MPELPDVEGFRRILSDHAVGQRIHRVDVLDTGVLHGITIDGLQQALDDRRFGQPWRHGKYLVVPVATRRGKQAGAVLLHFGMTGSLLWTDGHQHRHDRIVFVLGDGELRYRDMRKLHGLRFARSQQAVDRIVSGLGPDATELSVAQLRDRLIPRRRQVKPALLDQSIVAGLGNLLADEILWRARIHPRRQSGSCPRCGTTLSHGRVGGRGTAWCPHCQPR